MAQSLTFHRIGQDLLTPLRLLRAVFTGIGRPAPATIALPQAEAELCGVPPGLDRFQEMLLDLSSQAHLRRTMARPNSSLRATLKTVGTALVLDPTTGTDNLPIEQAHLDAILADLTPLHGLATVRAQSSARGVVLTVGGLRIAPYRDGPDLQRIGRIAALYDGHVAERIGPPGALSETDIFLPRTID